MSRDPKLTPKIPATSLSQIRPALAFTSPRHRHDPLHSQPREDWHQRNTGPDASPAPAQTTIWPAAQRLVHSPAIADGAAAAGRRNRTGSRASLWREGIVLLGLLWVYDSVNNLAALRREAAFAHAWGILRVESRLGVNVELGLNRLVAAHRGAALAVGDYYGVLHFAVTLGLMSWLWWSRPDRYRELRNTLVGINLIGFVVFWLYPLAPPRMLPSAGFVDIVAATHAVGAWSSSAVASQANEYAAMPSLHIAWAAWCGLALWRVSHHRAARAVAVAYPFATGLVVMATANHFLFDVVAGVATTGAAAVAVTIFARSFADGVSVHPRLPNDWTVTAEICARSVERRSTSQRAERPTLTAPGPSPTAGDLGQHRSVTDGIRAGGQKLAARHHRMTPVAAARRGSGELRRELRRDTLKVGTTPATRWRRRNGGQATSLWMPGGYPPSLPRPVPSPLPTAGAAAHVEVGP